MALRGSGRPGQIEEGSAVMAAMFDANLRGIYLAVRRFAANRPDIAEAVSVTTTIAANKDRTVLTLNHRVPSPLGGTAERFLVTARPTSLPGELFDPRVSATIAGASKSRRRAIFVVDLLRDSELVAAVRYHIHDEQHPVLAAAFAFRVDRPGDYALHASSQVAATLLTVYLQAIGVKAGLASGLILQLSPQPKATADQFSYFYRSLMAFGNPRVREEFGRNALFLTQPSF